MLTLAKTGYGINSLREMISEKLFENHKLMTVELTPSQGEIRSSIYQNCNVLEEVYTKSGHNLIKFMAMQSYIKYLAKIDSNNIKIKTLASYTPTEIKRPSPGGIAAPVNEKPRTNVDELDRVNPLA